MVEKPNKSWNRIITLHNKYKASSEKVYVDEIVGKKRRKHGEGVSKKISKVHDGVKLNTIFLTFRK